MLVLAAPKPAAAHPATHLHAHPAAARGDARELAQAGRREARRAAARAALARAAAASRALAVPVVLAAAVARRHVDFDVLGQRLGLRRQLVQPQLARCDATRCHAQFVTEGPQGQGAGPRGWH